MAQKNVEIVRQAIAAWNDGDLDAILAMLHRDFEYRPSGLFPGFAPVYRGQDGWKEFWGDFRGTWESIRIAVDELREADQRVVILFTFDARGRDGLEVLRQFGNVWTLRDGLVERIEAYANWAEALEAAGLSE